jgi:hypothetical protein
MMERELALPLRIREKLAVKLRELREAIGRLRRPEHQARLRDHFSP